MDSNIIHHIDFVANQNSRYIFTIFVNFRHPTLHIFITLPISHVVDNNHSMSASVISRSYGSKSLLASSVPNLQLYSFSFVFNCANFEINTYRVYIS